MIKDKYFALVFRIAALMIAIAGILTILGVFKGAPKPRLLMYYTLQSNILAVALFIALIARTALSLRKGRNGNAGFCARFEMVCVIDILLTLVVYWSLLAPTIYTMVEEYSLWTFDNLAVHGITPLLCLMDYVLFTQPRHLKYRDVYYITIFPLLYLAATSIAGFLGYVYTVSSSDGLPVRFPYFFCDFDRIGLFVLVYITGMVIFFLLIGHGVYFIDRRIRRL